MYGQCWNIIDCEWPSRCTLVPTSSPDVQLTSQHAVFLVLRSPASSHLKTCICVSLAHFCWIHSEWFCSERELTYYPPLCGRISQNSRFGGSAHWGPHFVGRGDSREEDRVFWGSTSLLAVLQRNFLADKFVSEVHVCFSLTSITMNETIVSSTKERFSQSYRILQQPEGLSSVLNTHTYRI